MESFSRKLRDTIELALLVVWIPVFLLLVELPRGLRRQHRYRRPENQRAVALAVAVHKARFSQLVASTSVIHTNLERCYVLVSHPAWITSANGQRVVQTLDPRRTLYAVWYSDGRVVEVVTTQFAWGIHPESFVYRFEAKLDPSISTTA
jgi:hypothetical protein